MDRWMDEGKVVHVHDGALLAEKKELSFAGKWVELEITVLSEVSQTQKDKCLERTLKHSYVYRYESGQGTTKQEEVSKRREERETV